MAGHSPLSYDQLLQQYPDWVLLRADLYHREETTEATEQARLRALRETGYVVKFLQDHGLTRMVICPTAPDIPADLKVYLRDVTPDALQLHRTGYQKWCRRFERNMNADPSDLRILEKSLAEIRARSGTEVSVSPPAETAKPKRSRPPARKKPAAGAPPAPPPAPVEFRKYDDASWHYGGEFPDDLPDEAGATHTGMFLAWAVLNGLASADHLAAFRQKVAQLEARKITPGRYFLATCDGKFTTEDLSAEGNAFARACFDPASAPYINDYEGLLATGLPSAYHVPDTWETFDRLSPLLDRRFSEWKLETPGA